jgi:hypothetical protein
MNTRKHVTKIRILSLPPEDYVVAVTQLQPLDVRISKPMSDEEATTLEKRTRREIQDGTFDWRNFSESSSKTDNPVVE